MIKLLKTDDIHKTVSFCILTPDIEDRNGDVITSEEIIKIAHDFGANMQNKFLNIYHEDNTQIEKT
ncbi:MAG: XkdF-like putative serine protease domain-containing protein [Candidatus Gracilibacteria bacterium]|nr:XkdF-like putative serine protease domain-containing protein [Candidatus Gracilibacteria bacterium]